MLERAATLGVRFTAQPTPDDGYALTAPSRPPSLPQSTPQTADTDHPGEQKRDTDDPGTDRRRPDHDPQGFTALLGTEPGIQVVGQAADGLEAVALTEELRPDVVLMDIRMPALSGIEATRQILQDPAAAKILILTTLDLDEYVCQALRAGGSGFLLKDASAEQLADAVRIVAAREGLLAPSVTKRLLTRFARMEAPQLADFAQDSLFTERETECWRSSDQACPTARSPPGSSSPSRRGRPTSAASSPNSTCATAPTP